MLLKATTEGTKNMNLKAQKIKSQLTRMERFQLVGKLNSLPRVQFDQVLIALNPPPGIIPSDISSQGDRTFALFQWLEGPTGPSLAALIELLQQIPSLDIDEIVLETTPRYRLTLDVNANTVEMKDLEKFVAGLSTLLGDDSIRILDVSLGSLRIEITGRPEKLKILEELFIDKKVKKIEGFPVSKLEQVGNHVSVLKLGVQAWNQWRLKKPELAADLRKAELSNAELNGVDFSRTLLAGANLDNASLCGANLKRANLSDASLYKANLRGAYLDGAYLSGASLQNAFLSGASLFEACLASSDLNSATLHGADLRRSDLSNSSFGSASLRGADLSDANLQGANLRNADISESYFRGANLDKALLPHRYLGNSNPRLHAVMQETSGSTIVSSDELPVMSSELRKALKEIQRDSKTIEIGQMLTVMIFIITLLFFL